MSNKKSPIVFISYSHDSSEHKQWVANLGIRLRKNGVDAILDQWDLFPGDDVPSFMENKLSSCQYALLICTKRYVKKANAGIGGVGYEKMIVHKMGSDLHSWCFCISATRFAIALIVEYSSPTQSPTSLSV